jgi:PhnB protein
MSTKSGYNDLQPYLTFKGCAEAIEFYKKAFGATERMRMPNANGGIGHAEIAIGDSIVCMADEATHAGAYSAEHYGGSPVSLLLYVDDCDSGYRRALDAGATSLREPADQPYGDRMSGVQDPFGFQWWIATPLAMDAKV